ncbi:MAG: undecaprenyl-diphosphate phosphatase [Pseudoflavonifractor sp.]|nr:undecaprenyl-diphosphate phosphatase [Alloprevotella sp.]MCM1115987.1 undecaprenyl-diphosphate phosphatase [Pseudoflavonifractor sp.]
MTWFEALIMGIVQGLSEYLPISSSGHLEICRSMLGINLPDEAALNFTVALHAATVLSTLTVLRSEFVPLCKSFFTLRRDENTSYVWKILLSCIPIAIVGFCFKDQIETLFGGNLHVVGYCLLATALLLSFAYFCRTRGDIANGRIGRPVGWLDAFIIGVAQAVAVLPGLSRSGTTIATGILLGDDRADVARFSFFMVIIPILGEALLDMVKMIGANPDADSMAVGAFPLALGFIASYVVGCFACRWMIRIVSQGKMIWFALYCALMGIACIIW